MIGALNVILINVQKCVSTGSHIASTILTISMTCLYEWYDHVVDVIISLMRYATDVIMVEDKKHKTRLQYQRKAP